MCNLDPSPVQFIVGFTLLWESNAMADLTGGGAQAVMPATGSSCKYGWSFICSPVAHYLLCGLDHYCFMAYVLGTLVLKHTQAHMHTRTCAHTHTILMLNQFCETLIFLMPCWPWLSMPNLCLHRPWAQRAYPGNEHEKGLRGPLLTNLKYIILVLAQLPSLNWMAAKSSNFNWRLC